MIVGRQRLVQQLGVTVPAEVTDQCRRWEQAGCTTVLAGWDGRVRGTVAVADTVKPSAAAGSSAFVLANSVRLRRFGPRPCPARDSTGRVTGSADGREGVA